MRGRFKFLHPQKTPNTTYGWLRKVLSFREKGSGKCSDVGTVVVNARYGRGFKLLVDSFEQVIAKVSRRGSTDHCQVPPEVLDLVWAPTPRV